jgi:GR25 family glycosyltransferase involved in LPS biosynthesis
VRVLVINAPFYHERRAFQMRQARRLGLTFEFVDGFDASKLSDEDAQAAADHWTRPIVKKDVACFHSHRAALKRVAEGHEWVLVLEDDVVLSDRLIGVLDAIKARPLNEYSAFDLEFVPKRHLLARRAEWQNAEGSVVASRIYQNKIGLAAYVVSPKAAARMLAERTDYAMIDAFFWTRTWLKSYQIEPAPAVQLVFIPSDDAKMASALPLHFFMSRKPMKRFRQRLANRLNDAHRFLLGLLYGQSRMLRCDEAEFRRLRDETA